MFFMKYFIILVCVLLIAGCNITGETVKSFCGDYSCDYDEDCEICPEDCGLCKGANIFDFECEEREEEGSCFSLCRWTAVAGDDYVEYRIQISIDDVKSEKTIVRYKYDAGKLPGRGRDFRESIEIEHSCGFGEEGFEYDYNSYTLNVYRR